MISVVQYDKILFRSETSLETAVFEYTKAQGSLVEDGDHVTLYVHQTMTRAAKRVQGSIEHRTLSGFRQETRSMCSSCSTKTYETCDACEKSAQEALILWARGF